MLPSKIRLEEMVSLAMIKGNSSSGPIKKMFHVPSMSVYCVKEVPINSRDSRNGLKRIIGEWETAISGESNPHLVDIAGTFWNSPEGCVSVVTEHMKGGSLLNLLESIGSIPEDLLRDMASKMLKALDYLHNTAKITHNGLALS